MTSEDTKLCLYKLFHNKEILVFVRFQTYYNFRSLQHTPLQPRLPTPANLMILPNIPKEDWCAF